MKDQLLGQGRKLWTEFLRFTPGQKAVTIVAALALVIGGYLLLTWHSSPQYAPLYSNLAASDASAIADKLHSNNIPYQLANGGQEILVPASDVDSARLTISAAGLPNSGQTGYALLDKEGVTTSQFQQQVDYQRAVEGELAKTIQSINGVQAASVHLAIPQQDVFNDGSQKPTAAVLLTVAPGGQLTTSQVQSVVYLVSSSVTGMSPDGVTVTDSNGNVLSAPGTDGVTSGVAATTQNQATQQYDTQLAATVQNMIDTALGPGHAVVTVHATLNFDKSSTTTNSYVHDKNVPPLSSSVTKEQYSGTGAGAAGGTLGATTTGPATTNSGNGTYSNTQTTVNNALGTVTQTVQNAPGAVENQHIAVELDRSAKNLNVAAITKLVQSAVGLNAARGDTLSVQTLAFDNSAQKAATASAKAAAAAAASNASHAKLIKMAKEGLLAALLIAIGVGAWLAGRKRRGQAPPPALPDHGLDLIDDLTGAHPEPLTEKLPAVPAGQDSNTVRRDLVAAVDNRPADVAHVLSGWLSTKEG